MCMMNFSFVKFLLANDFKVEQYCALEANVLGHIFWRSFHLSVHSFSQALSNDRALTLTLVLWYCGVGNGWGRWQLCFSKLHFKKDYLCLQCFCSWGHTVLGLYVHSSVCMFLNKSPILHVIFYVYDLQSI